MNFEFLEDLNANRRHEGKAHIAQGEEYERRRRIGEEERQIKKRWTTKENGSRKRKRLGLF
jgi:hypothetical protein